MPGKDTLKKAEEEEMNKQSKKRPRPMLLPHMTPLLKVRVHKTLPKQGYHMPMYPKELESLNVWQYMRVTCA